MKIAGGDAHLTYCLNVHAGEDWEDNLAAIQTHAHAVRAEICPDAPFGLGLRISAAAANTLSDTGVRRELIGLLRDEGMYAFTVNAFPYGVFHGQPVKQEVYRPDWRNPERQTYTNRVADILADLLPEDMDGSISTVPVGYGADFSSATAVADAVGQLVASVSHLVWLHDQTGRTIHLGLEPEPDCFLETTAQVVSFWEQHLLTHGVTLLAQRLSCSRSIAEEHMRTYLGVCFDTCHLALQFEDLPAALNTLRQAGIRVSKVQISSALSAPLQRDQVHQLRAFDDPVYLHQVKIRNATADVKSYADLPDFLNETEPEWDGDAQCRVHCHVPLYFESHRGIGATSDNLTPAFFREALDGGVTHFEIETYTFDVLPEALQVRGVVPSIVAEYRWVLQRFGPTML